MRTPSLGTMITVTCVAAGPALIFGGPDRGARQLRATE